MDNERDELASASEGPVVGEEEQHPGSVLLRRTEHLQSSLFAGPLPPPEILEQYNRLVPDAAERILTMAETQAAHRRGSKG